MKGSFDLSGLDFFTTIGEWTAENLPNIFFSLLAIAVGYIAVKLIAREIKSLKTQNRLEQNAAYTLNRIIKWVIFMAVFSVILLQFGITLGEVFGLATVIGGTIIGFASINTLGNTIAGLIVMSSRPFKVGDRIFFNGQFADVEGIELIYTKMRTLDNVLVSIPNQELLKSEIDNYGKTNTVRRACAITAGFELSSDDVEAALMDAANKLLKTKDIIADPKPYVWVTKFGNFAVEYTLYVFIDQIKRLPEIDSEIKRTVLRTCKEHNIDITT
ncbi:MAG: mechanosensitive ion channel family protein, partial [Candidatus Bathyarchaeota archaeon]|nr:mechanosensitive ion channel family protein [Candidatus Bathyarchaeota archaeon]